MRLKASSGNLAHHILRCWPVRVRRLSGGSL
jgi:hypothetical protein